MKKDYTKAIKEVGSIIDMWLPSRMGYAHIPGMAVAITSKGKLAYANGFGYGDEAKKQKITPDTIFRIASISKVFTAVAVMQLAENRLLKLSDPVSKHVPWFTGKAADITIEDLLSHSSGICRDGNTQHWNNGDFPEELESAFSKDALILQRGSGFKYSNYGYSILGQVIETITETPYEEYVELNILKPLGMRATSVDYDPSLPNQAEGFERYIPDQKRKTFPHYKANAYAPATGFSSSAKDLSKLAVALLKNVGPQVLTAQSKKKMGEKEWDTGGSIKYGLGIDVLQIGKRKVYGHSGGFLGFTLMMVFDPKEELTVVVLINNGSMNASVFALSILEMIYAGGEKRISGNARNHTPYTGIYRDNWRDTVCASLGGSLIAFSPNTDMPFRIALKRRPTKEKDTFVMDSADRFNAIGEKVIFTDFKNRKAQKIESYLGTANRIL